MTIIHLLGIAVILNWLLLLGLAISVVRLQNRIASRQRGELPDEGPAVGSVAPPIDAPLNGHGVGNLSLPRVVWFMSADCSTCKRLSPAAEAIARDFSHSVQSVVNCTGTVEGIKQFSEQWHDI